MVITFLDLEWVIRPMEEKRKYVGAGPHAGTLRLRQEDCKYEPNLDI